MASRAPPKPPSTAAPDAAKKRVARCPICTAASEPQFRPFCSSRCADVDLSRWLRGGYAIAGRADVDEDGEDTAAQQAPARKSEEGQSEADHED